MLHVVCIRAGAAFAPAYVTVLQDMVARNLEGGFPGRFVCFTDRRDELPLSVETRPLPADLPGWWSKLALFRDGLFPDGDRVLFFDLDTVITGSIDALAKYEGEFAILRDFYRPNGLQSSVMAWRAGQHAEIWRTFEAAGCPMDDPGGDQAWIEKHCHPSRVQRLQTMFPEMFVSYKQCRGIPQQASVVVFHGRPRPHEITDGWVPKVWTISGLSHAELKAVCNTELEKLLGNVRSACQRNVRWFVPRDEHNGHVAILGGGPSLADMTREIKWRQSQGQVIWALNNAWRAIDVHVDAQVLLDARAENSEFICDMACEHLVASQCHPDLLDRLSNSNVTLWHANTPGIADLLKDEPSRPAYLVGGGTTVGMNAIALAYLRGYRKIHLYGFDSCFRGEAHHAYPQALNDKDARNTVLYGDKNYLCAPWMVGQAQEFAEMWPTYDADDCVITVHGAGLLQDIWRDLARTMTPAEQRADEILKRVNPGARIAEIGVFAGDLSKVLLKSPLSVNMIMVDSWEGDGKAYQAKTDDWHAALSSHQQTEFFNKTAKRVAFANGRSVILKKRSHEALADVPDGSCDLVFIDADHSYEGCKADIEGWRAKVKAGGWIGGHDYDNPDFEFGVKQAVDEFVAKTSLQLETGKNFCWFVQL